MNRIAELLTQQRILGQYSGHFGAMSEEAKKAEQELQQAQAEMEMLCSRASCGLDRCDLSLLLQRNSCCRLGFFPKAVIN